jgi:hypothetical protein
VFTYFSNVIKRVLLPNCPNFFYDIQNQLTRWRVCRLCGTLFMSSSQGVSEILGSFCELDMKMQSMFHNAELLCIYCGVSSKLPTTYKTYVITPTAHISVEYDIGSKLTTSGATNSGVPNKTCNFLCGSCFLANPKSMILI